MFWFRSVALGACGGECLCSGESLDGGGGLKVEGDVLKLSLDVKLSLGSFGDGGVFFSFTDSFFCGGGGIVIESLLGSLLAGVLIATSSFAFASVCFGAGDISFGCATCVAIVGRDLPGGGGLETGSRNVPADFFSCDSLSLSDCASFTLDGLLSSSN